MNKLTSIVAVAVLSLSTGYARAEQIFYDSGRNPDKTSEKSVASCKTRALTPKDVALDFTTYGIVRAPIVESLRQTLARVMKRKNAEIRGTSCEKPVELVAHQGGGYIICMEDAWDHKSTDWYWNAKWVISSSDLECTDFALYSWTDGKGKYVPFLIHEPTKAVVNEDEIKIAAEKAGAALRVHAMTEKVGKFGEPKFE